MSSSRETSTGTKSVERALSLLTTFSDRYSAKRISELVADTGLGQSTVSRLVGTLTALGFLAHDERTGLYTLGHENLRLANIALNYSPVHQRARQFAQELAHETGLGVNVAERDGDRFLYLLNFEGKNAPRAATLVGRTGPLHATALGKCLLSDLSADEVRATLGPELPRFTPHTIDDSDELLREVARVRDRGYAVEREEAALGRACVAAPVRGREGSVVAALSISGPLAAMQLDAQEPRLAESAIHWAGEISSELGFLGLNVT